MSRLRMCACLILLAFAGCEKQAEISRYTVPKLPPPPQSDLPAMPSPTSAAAPGRLLGAIFPQGETTWFFKLTGPKDVLVEQSDNFLQFVQSVRFGADKPRWQLPEGWRESGGSEMRFATIRFDARGQTHEMSVIPLPTGGGDYNEYLLANINRWRGQMNQGPISQAELAKTTVTLDVNGVQATIVNIDGPEADRSRADNAKPAAAPSGAESALPFQFAAPAEWTRQAAGPMRLAAFQATDGNQRVVVSISSAGGDLVANINRWRGQVQLEPLEADKLKESLREIALGEHRGMYAELVGPEASTPRQTILGVVVQAAGQQWFFKLQGDSELAAKEKERFEAFVKSIRFK
jgi:hypothetical protein